MKQLQALLCCMLFMQIIFAQAPTQINYQGIARNPGGNVFPNQSMTLRLKIHDGSAAGPVVYSETRNITTNAFGLFNVAIGSPGASSVVGSVGTVNWAAGNKFLQVELDPNGGSGFINMGTSQLLSVPYALYATGAAPVGPAGGDLTGTYPNPTVAKIRGVNVSSAAPVLNNLLGFDGTNWTPVSLATHPDNYWRAAGGNIYNANAANVGIGTLTPAQKLDVNGNLQTLGFIMPTGAGSGKVLISDAVGNGSWSSSIVATSIVLPYKDSAASNTANIFHIIQTSTNSTTGALYGVTRSTAADAFGAGGQVSNLSAGAYSAGLRGENLSTTNLGIGVYGSQNGSGWGVYGTTPTGTGVFGLSNNGNGVAGTSSTRNGVYGLSNVGYANAGAVFGFNPGDGGNGIFGYATRRLGFGAIGYSDSSSGVYGITNAQTFAAYSNDGAGVYGIASRGGVGVYGYSALFNAGKFEIKNAANAEDVVVAQTLNTSGSPAAVHGINGLSGLTLFFRKGVYGETEDGIGVMGTTNSGYGSLGIANTGVGVYGSSHTGFAGIIADHFGTGYGLFANSNNGVAGRFDNVGASNSNDVLQSTTTGVGRSAHFQNFNAANNSTTLEVNSNGGGRAIVARSNFPGPVNGGVVDVLTTQPGGNAVYGRATRFFAWGVYGLSDSSAGTAGIGFRPGSVGIYGQGWEGGAGQFVIDNSFVNTSTAVEVLNSQSGMGLYANSHLGITAKFENNNAVNSNDVLQSISNGTGRTALIQNTNAANNQTTLDVISNGTGRAIRGRSNLPGPVNAGVIDGLTTVPNSNAVFGRATRSFGWGILGMSDSSAGVGGVGILPVSVGVYGQGWGGKAGQFIIDNTFANDSNVLEVSTTQGGNAVIVKLSNSADGVNVNQGGNGNGIYSSSEKGIAGKFENTNATNGNNVIFATTNGTGRPLEGITNNPANVFSVIRGETNGDGNGVLGFGTNNNSYKAGVYGLHNGTLGNGVIGWGTKSLTFGMIAHSDSSTGIYAESGLGNAANFLTLQSNSTVPTLYSQTNGLSNVASFNVSNISNTADAVLIDRIGAGRSLKVDGAAFNNTMNFYSPLTTGKSTEFVEGRSGLAILGHAGGTFQHSATEKVGVGVYGIADATGSNFNYGIVGYGSASVGENAGVFGYINGNSTGTRNAAIYGIDYGGAGNRFAGFFIGDVEVTGTLSKGGGSFKIDHPTDPQNKYLVHSFVESPDMMNVYNGNTITDADGKAIVELPGYFEAENVDFRYQLTVIGQFAQAIVGEEIKGNKFVVLTDKPNVKVSWQVTGIRNDKWAQKNRIVPEPEKKGNEKGKYLYPELYGQAQEAGIAYMKPGSVGPIQSASVNRIQLKETERNIAQEQINKETAQKRIMVQNQVNSMDVSSARTRSTKPAVKQPATIQTQSAKTRLMSQSLEMTDQDKAGVKDNSNQASMKSAPEKTHEGNSALAEKTKRLSENMNASNENNDMQKVNRPRMDSLVQKQAVQQRQQPVNEDPASIISKKHLDRMEIKVPNDEKQNPSSQKGEIKKQ